jgi:hypothetical protein
MLGVSQAVLLGSAAAGVTYDLLVATFGADVVSYWKFQNDGVDQRGTAHATITGSPELNVETIVRLDALADGAPADGQCIAWPGAAGVFAEAAHNAAHKTPQGTIVVTFQHDSLAHKATLLTADANEAAGGLSVEVLPDGTPRCFLRRQADGLPVALVGEPGDIGLNQAHTLVVKWGPGGLSMGLWNQSGLLLRRRTDPLADGVTGTSPIRFGIWHDGAQSPHDGPYGRVIWLKRRIGDAEEAVLARARTIVRDDVLASEITLKPIYMWKNPNVAELKTALASLGPNDLGELKITDTAIGGTIASASGGTLPAFAITVDPTAYVSAASGSKASWLVAFRNTTLGTWTRLANGDLQFTPGTTPGQDSSEYRVSDDAGASWSGWAPLVTLVLDRSLTPGPYFLVEDYGGGGGSHDGVDTPRFNAARDAAVAAGGGTVTTLQRSTVRMVTNHQARARVHYLFPNVKRPDMIHVPTGRTVDDFPNGGGPGSDWQPGWTEPLLAVTHSSLVGQARINVVGGTIDGNMFRQALHDAFSGTPVASSEYGKAWPGNGSNSSTFNLQLQRLIEVQGSTAGGPAARASLGVHGVLIRHVPADGIHCTGAGDVLEQDCIFSGCFRGGIVMDFGNSKLVARRGAYVNCLGAVNNDQNVGCGIDHEILGFGSPNSWLLDILHEDEFIDGDFEFNPREGPGHTVRGCVIGAGLDWLAKGTVTTQLVVHEGSAANPRGTIRYHRKAPTGGNFPATAIRGWAGTPPHNMTVRFIDQDFVTWGAFYIYHEKRITPAAGLWEIQLGETLDTSSALRVELTNCTASTGQNMPAGSNTVRLFRTVKSLTTTQVVRLDGLTIGAGFERDAVLLDGQRLEYRNVAHLGFPGATIQQICPGAGQYVPI